MDIGKLERKPRTEVLARIKRLAPNIDANFLNDWDKRLLENSELVWDCWSKVENRKEIKNPAAYANTLYLNTILEKKPFGGQTG